MKYYGYITFILLFITYLSVYCDNDHHDTKVETKNSGESYDHQQTPSIKSESVKELDDKVNENLEKPTKLDEDENQQNEKENVKSTNEEVDDKKSKVDKTNPGELTEIFIDQNGASKTNKQSKNEQNEDMSDKIEEDPKAEALFQEGLKIMNVSGRRKTRMQLAYKYFLDASELNHTIAIEKVALGSLLGDGLPLSWSRATILFKKLVEKGNARGNFGLGLLAASGILQQYNMTTTSSNNGDSTDSKYITNEQALAFLYYTFSGISDDTYGQMAMAYRYFQGITVDLNCERALAFYRRVAKKVMNSVHNGPKSAGVHRIHLIEEAEANTGIYGQSAVHTLLDDDLLQYYHFLAEKGDTSAQVGLGHLYYEGGRGVNIDHEKALHYLRQASEHGNTNAMAYLGQMYLEGSDIVPANNQTAYEYFKKASELGNALGMSGLGLMYLEGKGVERDYEKAFKYFSMSTQHGLVDGQLQLGLMYFHGLGVRTDYKTAKKYFELAAQQGNVVAIYNLALMYSYGTGVVRNCVTAAELFKNVAERGRWSTGLMEAHRSFKQKRFKEAYIKYLMLAEIGFEVAQSNVAYILEQGLVKFMPKEERVKRAFMMLHRSASQGYVVSRLKLGDCYYYGIGTKIDYEKSAYHYRIASENQHNPQAMFNLGYMHENGLGVDKDIHLAKRFYDMAESITQDASLPVKLALTKLQFHFFMESFSFSDIGTGLASNMNPRSIMGPMWDLYVVAVLISVLTILVILYQDNRRRLAVANQRRAAGVPEDAAE